ncbi:MAG: SH3 domain-containing protein [Anaerolineae bacterium]|nr:SH3 domain-containing protein [Anaerolineae bacterium]
MGKQIFTRFPLLMGLLLAIVIAVLGIASPTAKAVGTEASPQASLGLAALAVPPALPVQVQSTPTSTATIQSIPSVVIVSPVADQVFTSGELIPVVSKSADPQGITRIDLMVNDKLLARISNMNPQTNRTRTASQVWLPDIAGSHVLQVIAYNAAGVTGESELVFVQVQPATPTPTPVPASPTPTATPTFPYLVVTSAGSLRVRAGPGTQYDSLGFLQPNQEARITGRNLGADLWWQINFPVGTQELGWVTGNPEFSTAYHVDGVPTVATPPPPTPTASPTPAVSIDFRVDRTEIQRGECVNFFWNVYGVQAVYFQGKGVSGDNQSRRECPQESTTYSLRVERADGSTETRDIQINVRDDDNDSYVTTTVRREDKIDFDNGAQPSEENGDFLWYFDGDRPVFEKADADENDIKLVPLQPGDLDDFQNLDEDTCRAALDQQNQLNLTIALDLMVCFATDQERIGKLRFTGGSQEELIMQWHLW